MATTVNSMFNDKYFHQMLEKTLNEEIDNFIAEKIEQYKKELTDKVLEHKPRLALMLMKQFDFEYHKDKVVVYLKSEINH